MQTILYIYKNKHIYKKISSECLEIGHVPLINTTYLPEDR